MREKLSKTLQRFCTDSPAGKCTNPYIEFGNLHRQEILCSYYSEGECYFCDKCERREGEVENEGWWIV